MDKDETGEAIARYLEKRPEDLRALLEGSSGAMTTEDLAEHLGVQLGDDVAPLAEDQRSDSEGQPAVAPEQLAGRRGVAGRT